MQFWNYNALCHTILVDEEYNSQIYIIGKRSLLAWEQLLWRVNQNNITSESLSDEWPVSLGICSLSQQEDMHKAVHFEDGQD